VVIFSSESDLLEQLDKHDRLVRACVRGELSFDDFCAQYQHFHDSHALDGHESDDEERALLEKHRDRIEPHRVIAQDILGRVCADEDARREVYRLAGRFGKTEALRRLAEVRLQAV